MEEKWELKEIGLSDSGIPLFALFVKREPFEHLEDLIEKCKTFTEKSSYVVAINGFTHDASKPHDVGIGCLISGGWNSAYLVEERENIDIINPKTPAKQHTTMGPYFIYSLYTYGGRSNFIKSIKEKEKASVRLIKDAEPFYKVVSALDKKGFDRTKKVPDLIKLIVEKYVPKKSWAYYFNPSAGKAMLLHYPKRKEPCPKEFSKFESIDVF